MQHITSSRCLRSAWRAANRGAFSSSRISIRTYRGDSGEMKSRQQVIQEIGGRDDISEQEQALLAVAKPKYDEIYERHIRLPQLDDATFSTSSDSKEAQELEIRKKRLTYRAKQRGWLEVDLLLGTWARQNVPSLTLQELDEFEEFVNLETVDIYNVLTLRTDIPEKFKDENLAGVVRRIQTWAESSPLGRAEPEKYAKMKQENNLI